MRSAGGSAPLRASAFVVILASLLAGPGGVAASPAVATGGGLPYAEAWGRGEPGPAFAAFQSWASRFVLDGASADLSSDAVADGVEMARQRRAVLLDLMRTDPERALALAVPAAARERLPIEIRGLLETRVAGIGDFTVVAASGALAAPVERFVKLNGREYRAYVYGRRAGQTTKWGIPLHGIVLDGALALHESALRVLEEDEVPDASQPIVDLGVEAAAASPVRAEMGGRIYRFASQQRLLDAEAAIEAAEAGLGPRPLRPAEAVLEAKAWPRARGVSLPAPPSAWTTGNKKLLVIRVDFSDIPGDPHYGFGATPVYTAAYVQSLSDSQIAPFLAQSSYALTSLTTTATTQLYRMPQTATAYALAGNNTALHADAEALASANYNLASYDRIAVLFAYLGGIAGSSITYGGRAQVGGPNLWVNGFYDLRVVTHELGHTYGLFHANLWQVGDGNPISGAGSSTEYGDDFDMMGSNFANDPRADFNPWFKNMLGWIGDAQVTTVTASGTYRVTRFDHPASTTASTLALRVPKDATTDYWIGARRQFTNNSSMQHGAYVMWGYGFNQQSNLLDTTTPGTGVADAALAIGAPLSDPAAQVTIRPVGEGGASPSEYLDVQVTVPPPTVASISPAFGPTAGGTAVTIKGRSFAAPASVTFGGALATSVSVNGPDTITATTPPNPKGVVDVVVAMPGPVSATRAGGFTYGLRLLGVSPEEGPTSGGIQLWITGANFAAPATVTVGGASATSVSVLNGSTLTAVTAAHAPGVVDVAVSVPGPDSATLPGSFTYLTPMPTRFFTLAPCRLVDTRSASLGGPNPLGASSRKDFTITGGTCGVPAGALAVSVNVTVTQTAAAGFVTLFPANRSLPSTSNINFRLGQTTANNAVVRLATDGTGVLAVQNGSPGSVHFILDVNGYFLP